MKKTTLTWGLRIIGVLIIVVVFATDPFYITREATPSEHAQVVEENPSLPINKVFYRTQSWLAPASAAVGLILLVFASPIARRLPHAKG